MGNGNCCKEVRQNDKDVAVDDLKDNVNNENIIKIYPKVKSNDNETNDRKVGKDEIINSNSNHSYSGTFDYYSNKKNEKNITSSFKKQNYSDNSVNLVKHCTFRDEKFEYNLKFLEIINNARKNTLAFSDKLKMYSENFDLFEKVKSQIKNKRVKKVFKITKNDFFEASNLLKEWENERLKNNLILNDLEESEKFRLPIPDDIEELKRTKYFDRYISRFTRKYSKEYEIVKIIAKIVNFDPELSLLTILSKEKEFWKFLFTQEVSYVSIENSEYSEESYLLTLVFVKRKTN